MEEEATVISEIVEEATLFRAYSAFRSYGEDCGGRRHYHEGPGSLRGYGRGHHGNRCHSEGCVDLRDCGDDCECFRSYGGLGVCGGDLVSKDVIMQEVVGTDTTVVSKVILDVLVEAVAHSECVGYTVVGTNAVVASLVSK